VRDRGSMMILVVFVAVAVTAMVTIALMPVLGDLIDRQEARSAADAAALAGVTGGIGAASTLAAANDGVLVGWSTNGRQVTVQVRVGDQVVTARATDQP
jgi:MFS-type transporter involved in bile tolerance (Atg22 family)